MFTGREYVATFGVYEYRNRAYHPGLGRFMSEDPKGFAAGDNNFFRYCGNDPVDHTDPMGLSQDSVLLTANQQNLEHGQGANQWSASQQNASNQLRFTAFAPTAVSVDRAGGNLTFARVGGGWGVPNSQGSRLSPWKAPVRVIGGNFRERQHVRRDVKRVLATPRGSELAAMIRQQGLQRTIHSVPHTSIADSNTPGPDLRIDPYFHPQITTTQGPVDASTARIIGHELGHAVTGAGQLERSFGAMDNVMQNENPIATRLDPPEPARTQY